VSKIANINFQLSSQSVIIFLVGLFGTEKVDVHPWILAVSSLTSFVYVFCIYFGYTADKEDDDTALNSGISGVAVQITLICALEFFRRYILPLKQHSPSSSRGTNSLRSSRPASHSGADDPRQDLLFPDRPSWDIPKRKRFGVKPLTPKLLWRMMEGTNEPLANSWYVALMVLCISWCTPWLKGGFPAKVEDIPSILVNGIPFWVMNLIVSAAITSFFIILQLYQMPNKFPRLVRRGKRRGGGHQGSAAPSASRGTTTTLQPQPQEDEEPDPDVMELTQEELLTRTAYDERNDLVYKRRRQILEKLGISKTEIDSIVASTQRQLQNFEPHLITGGLGEFSA